ncbi:MAG: lipoprotein [Siculibacillus sp.]|nr:lipoprotein [Siculibacillus sp.]
MTSPSSLLLRLAVIGLVGLGASSLAACGRKGDPEVPTKAAVTADRPVGIPVGPTAPRTERPEPQRRSFPLDPLL